MKQTLLKLSILMLLAAPATGFLTGCEDDSAADNMEEAGENVQDAAQEAGDNMQDAAEDAGDEIEDATN
ncbi:MAG: hypothetical protein E1N59_1837 [Puniceicoccaceae bacterium 5H]|nr:MAG: hypothetical protein E1N59_1837 [Puniceicoccaceae bacterium 5H]